MTIDTEHHFICLLVSCLSSLEKNVYSSPLSVKKERVKYMTGIAYELGVQVPLINGINQFKMD